jgi:general secretion pathway protein L
MAEFLVIRLGTDANLPVQWIAVDDSGTRRGELASGTLGDAKEHVGERAVIALVPAAATLTMSIDIPVRGGARLLAALPFALEEQLAEDVETLHFAAGTRRESGLLPVAVVSHVQMREWLELFESEGISPARIIPENFGLARIAGTLSMLVAENQVMFNDGADTEFLMQSVKPSDALDVAGVFDEADTNEAPEEQSSAHHVLVYCEASDEDKFNQDWVALRQEFASVDINLLPDGVLPRLAVTVATGAGIDLLQGSYGARTDFKGLFRPWRYAAMLLLALGITSIGGKAVENVRLGQEQASLQEQFNREYREMRPNDTQAIADPMATVNSVRRSLGAPAAPQAFLPSLEQIGKALRANESAEVEAVSYRAGVVDIRLSAPDVATLDSIQKIISESGRFTASIQSTDQVGDKVNSRIQVREVGA